jgi:hypothetical protein
MKCGTLEIQNKFEMLIYYFYLFIFGAGDQTQGCGLARQMYYY